MDEADQLPLVLAALVLLAVLAFAWLWPLPTAIRRRGWRDLRLWALLLLAAQLTLYWQFG